MKINALGTDISVIDSNGNFKDNYISLTDLAKYKDANDPRIVISNWMSSYSTIDFLSTWESFYNPNFNRMEFQTFLKSFLKASNSTPLKSSYKSEKHPCLST